jgi:hypothetical protein
MEILPEETECTEIADLEDDCYADQAGPSIYDTRTWPRSTIPTFSSSRHSESQLRCIVCRGDVAGFAADSVLPRLKYRHDPCPGKNMAIASLLFRHRLTVQHLRHAIQTAGFRRRITSPGHKYSNGR